MTVPFKPEIAPWLADWIGKTQPDATRVAPKTPQLPPIPTIGPANAPARPGVQAALEGYSDPMRPVVQGLQAAQTAAEFLPSPFGDVASAGAAVREARAGNPGMAALSAAGALPLVPSIAASRKAAKLIGKDANEDVLAVAEAMIRNDPMPRVAKVDAEKAAHMAKVYEQLPKFDPEAKAAYDLLNEEVAAQAKAIQDAGYRFEFVDSDPYANSAEMMKDVRENKRLKVFKTPRPPETLYHGTKADFDTFQPSSGGELGKGIYFTDDPNTASKYASYSRGEGSERVIPVHLDMKRPFVTDNREAVRGMGPTRLQRDGYDGVIYTSPTGEKQYLVFKPEQVKRASDEPGFHPYMTPEQNDTFRAVHDWIAHAGPGNQFGPIGEENAYRMHAATLSPQAQRALASETRGQNSWVNFGPNAHLPMKERPFAEQKAALWPEEFLGDYDKMPAPRPREWSPTELEAFGAKHGVPGLGRESEPSIVKLSDGREVNIPGGTEGTFSYYDMLTLKAQGINPNQMPEGMHDKVHAKMMRSMSNRDQSDEDLFRMLSFGLTSPNSPLTPNEFTVSRLMPQNMDDIKKLAAMDGKSGAEIAHHFGVDAASKGGLGTSGSLDYKVLPRFAKMFSENPKWFRRGADEPWDQYTDRLATQIPGLGTKTASLGGVWQDLPNAAVSAVDRHMTELAMPHILDHPELGPDFRERVVASWNNVEGRAKKDRVKTLEQIRERDPIYARDFLASLINDPQKVAMRDRKGNFGKNVPEWMRKVQWAQEPETTTLMNPYYREALKYNQGLQQPGESLFESQWRLWDKQRGRIEPHEVMFPGLNKLPRMPLEDARAAYKTHHAANYTRNGNAARLLEKAEGGQLPAVKPVANPMDLAYWSLGGLLLGGTRAAGEE